MSAVATVRAQARRGTHAARAGLVVVALAQAEVGIWGEVAPHSFWSGFPGLGHHWVSAAGPYDEHLVRDFASAELGLAVLLLCAAIWFERRLVLIAGAAFLAATIPHLAFHLFNADTLSTADNITSLGSFVLEIALVIWAMVAVLRAPEGRP